MVWLDMSRTPDDSNPRAIWSIESLNLATGLRWTVATSGRKPVAGTPLFRAARDSIVWEAPDKQSDTADIVTADLRSHVIRVLAKNVISTGVSVGDGVAAYTDSYPAGAPGATLASPPTTQDAYIVPTGGGCPRVVSRDHAVTAPSVGAGVVVWGSPMNGDQDTVWAAPIAGGAPYVVFHGGNVQREVGTGFVALWTNGDVHLLVVPDGSPNGPPYVLAGPEEFVPAHFGVDGNTIAFATGSPQETAGAAIVVHVVQVSVR